MDSLQARLKALAALLIVTGLLLLLALFKVGEASDQLNAASQRRYDSYLLADELRQSSDDLTRLARTYVESGDAQWEKQYLEVLDIRNGQLPRPKNYDKIYWDFRAAGLAPEGGSGETVSLQALMERAGFSDEEFAKLKAAEQNSNELVRTETIAMNLVKGLYDDGNGGFTRQGEPDAAKALAMMHDREYHANKAKIMQPVNEFLVLLDARTAGEVEAAQSARGAWFKALVAIALLNIAAGVGGLWYFGRYVLRRLGAEPSVVREVAEAVRRGELDTRLDSDGVARDSVMASMAAMREQLSAIVTQVRGASDSVARVSEEMAQGNSDLSARTELQASALQEAAASMEQLGTTVRQNADSGLQANQLAQDAAAVAERGGAVVSEVVETMKGIHASSQRIADIIGTIDGIAFQTNILALNAAVEAARAGEQGRGFAVVATEVRALAGRSAAAAREIKSLISASVERTEHGSTLVDQAGATMTEVVMAIQRVTGIIGEISTASSEQSVGVAQVGEAVSQMDRTTQHNSALVEQMAAASSNLKSQAQDLVGTVAVFKLG